MKWLIGALLLTVVFYLGLFGQNRFINKYWFPKEVRAWIVTAKFDEGKCLSSKHWGVNPKKVLAHKETSNSSYYLLKDMDHYEHLQLLSKNDVEKYAYTTPCRY